MGGKVHTCDACGQSGPWTDSWSWYGSYRDIDDGEPIFKACSAECMAKRLEVEERRLIANNIDRAKEEERQLEEALARKRRFREQEERRLALPSGEKPLSNPGER